MGSFELAYEFVKRTEGGYANHKDDHGGETNYGITQDIFNKAKELGIIDDSIASVKDITQDDAKTIYKEIFWDEINGDALPTDVAIAVFDMATNSGVPTSVKMLQEILGVTQDGKVGPETLAAIENYNGDLIDDFLEAREVGYNELANRRPKDRANIDGWINRLAALGDYIDNYNDASFVKLWINALFNGMSKELMDRVRSILTSGSKVVLQAAGSPIILDLDKDGVETTALTSGTYFDLDSNGFAEQTGWVDSGDGLLAIDRNNDGQINNGTELFGNETLLADGTKAANGFQALAELDTNTDGKIDANDTAYSQLRIWQDYDEDGYTSEGELKTLEELGIQSINTFRFQTISR